MLVLDGSLGEGGGQIVRTALTLSMITGTPVTIENVRAGRSKPGLLRQHLAALRAAQAVASAEVTGDELGSRAFTFRPKSVRAGAYRFDVGSAGSAMLVLQTVLPALLFADAPSNIEVCGGTHNPFAPPYPFFADTYLPLLARMGANVRTALDAVGFYPAGGGRVRIDIEPTKKLDELVLLDRGAIRARRIRVISARVPHHVAEREIATLTQILDWHDADARPETVASEGAGNVLLAIIEGEHVTETFSAFGERGVRAEQVAAKVAREVRMYLDANVPVGEHLSDQLVLPMALGSGGAFRTVTPSDHLRTHVDLLRRFLDRRIDLREEGNGAHRVEIAPNA